MDPLSRAAIDAFRKAYGADPRCLGFAPGRVEVLGNHTDYNGGYVLSVAIDLGVAVAAASHPDPGAVEIWSEAFQEGTAFRLERIERREGSWVNYPAGVLRELLRSGVQVRGLRLAVASNLPIGAGVSSSAALELATAEAAYELHGGRPTDRLDEARLCQRAEVEFAGVPCGLLDQFSSLCGKEDHVLFLDCATLRHDAVPLGRNDVRVVIAGTGDKHALVDGKYAELRRSCERAAGALGELLPHDVRWLRDVTVEELLAHLAALAPEDARRAEHVVRENARVLRGLAAVKARHYPELKRMMLESHASSRDLLGNSTPALDFLVDCAAGLPGFLGGKLTGGGFGGATVNLVEEARAAEFTAELARHFARERGKELQTITARIGGGARAERLG
jgi:galactokinase